MHILMIEDDLDLGRGLLKALNAEDISCQWLRRTADAPLNFFGETCDCILLDLSLPDGTGFELLKRWRQANVTIPIIIMTARSAIEDKLMGLDGGADDFVVKPFDTAELLSRVRAVVRRSAQRASEIWTIGDLQIEPHRFIARLNGTTLELSPREFNLLVELARDTGAYIPKGTLAQRLEPMGDGLDFGALEVHISNLRRKIGAERIRTLRGVGYMLAS
ncbi:MAG TPA: response regulator transcription factor [Steroidobacteraceae bacterium]|jgi:DNA-binding response OmpR family regulator|nr:response regulator transcription factor [Steroidobacteraceae bacterium]